jgi:hypothetical protein
MNVDFALAKNEKGLFLSANDATVRITKDM